MISLSDLFPIGYIPKTHGIKGEVSVTLTCDVDDMDFDYFVLPVNGIFVPFFAREIRFRQGSGNALIAFDGIADETAAKLLVGKTLYVQKDAIDAMQEEEDSLFACIGYTMKDKHSGTIGIIEHIDDSTENILFEVTNGDDTILIPAAEEFITDIDHRHKLLVVTLPEGLTGLNQED
jgi:16S rRNA processing protein RimM